jgi:excisionase family DNA binding protein
VTERLLTAREVADLLGFARGTIVDWFEAGKLPGFRVGGRLRFRASEVEVWLEGHRRGPEVTECAGREVSRQPSGQVL